MGERATHNKSGGDSKTFVKRETASNIRYEFTNIKSKRNDVVVSWHLRQIENNHDAFIIIKVKTLMRIIERCKRRFLFQNNVTKATGIAKSDPLNVEIIRDNEKSRQHKLVQFEPRILK